jgi:hypothetical protein
VWEGVPSPILKKGEDWIVIEFIADFYTSEVEPVSYVALHYYEAF